MTTAQLEKAVKKILKLVQVNDTAIRLTYKSMSVAEWLTWKRDNNDNIEPWLRFPCDSRWNCLVHVSETLLVRINLKQGPSKRRLFTIFGGFND